VTSLVAPSGGYDQEIGGAFGYSQNRDIRLRPTSSLARSGNVHDRRLVQAVIDAVPPVYQNGDSHVSVQTRSALAGLVPCRGASAELNV